MKFFTLNFFIFFSLVTAIGFANTSEDATPTAMIETDVIETFSKGDAINRRRAIRIGLKIAHKMDDDVWRVKNAAYPVVGQRISLRVQSKKVAKDITHVRWYLVFADITRIYKNANRPGEANAYKWEGMDPIQYHRIEIDEARGQREINPIVHMDSLVERIAKWATDHGAASWEVDFYKSRLGSFWFQVEGQIDGVHCRSVGLDDVTDRGISIGTFRISLRQSDDYLGWITSFYNVPGVFGSILYQSKHYLGADCADVMMAAWTRWRRKKMSKNYNVQMLLTQFPRRAETRINDGTPEAQVLWGTHVAPGDLIAVRYGDNGKKFHHVGALVGDTNGNGLLDADDRIIHAGPYPLHLTSLKEGAFDGHVVVLRPR